MRRRLAVLALFALLLAAPAVAQNIPQKCLRPHVTCIQNSDGSYTVDNGSRSDADGFPDPGTPDSPGIPSGFVALFVIVAVLGVGTTIWRVAFARRMARDAGMDPNTATAVTLLDNNGLDAAYIATSLRSRSTTEPAVRDAAARLRELQQLRDDNLITADEYDARRRAIVESV